MVTSIKDKLNGMLTQSFIRFKHQEKGEVQDFTNISVCKISLRSFGKIYQASIGTSQISTATKLTEDKVGLRHKSTTSGLAQFTTRQALNRREANYRNCSSPIIFREEFIIILIQMYKIVFTLFIEKKRF